MRESEMEYTAKQESYLKAAIAIHGEGAILSSETLSKVAEENKMGFPFWMTDSRRMGTFTKVDKNSYRLPAYNGGEGATEADAMDEWNSRTSKIGILSQKPEKKVVKSDLIPIKKTESTMDMSTYFNPAELIPKKDPLFVAHGHFSDLIKVLSSRKFQFVLT